MNGLKVFLSISATGHGNVLIVIFSLTVPALSASEVWISPVNIPRCIYHPALGPPQHRIMHWEMTSRRPLITEGLSKVHDGDEGEKL